MKLHALRDHLDTLLDTGSFKDYCPNGLQVEGRAVVERVLCGVTASQALLDHAVEHGFDAIVVHHGYFWRGEDARITGIRQRRIATLLRNDISLFAYHLPLDAHPELGNNAQLARVAGWMPERQCGENGLVWLGRPAEALTATALAGLLARALGRTPMLVGNGARSVGCVAWCTGGAQGYFETAIESGADVFVSGEISEQTVHVARESGVPFIAAGHHATERYGVSALAGHLREVLGLDARFVDLDNPV